MANPTGSNLQQDVADLMPRVDISVSAQQSRLMRHGDVILRQITAEILGVNPHWRLDSTTFSTVAATVPNEYAIGSGAAINITDFMGVQHLYRIISDSTGDYEEVTPFDQIRAQHEMGDASTIRGLLTGTASGTGPPRNYIVDVNSLWLFPISDQAYSMRLWYTKAPAAIAAGTAIDIPIALYNALVYGICREEAAMRKEDEWKEFQAMYASAMSSGLAAMIHQVESPRGINYIRDYPETYA